MPEEVQLTQKQQQCVQELDRQIAELHVLSLELSRGPHPGRPDLVLNNIRKKLSQYQEERNEILGWSGFARSEQDKMRSIVTGTSLGIFLSVVVVGSWLLCPLLFGYWPVF